MKTAMQPAINALVAEELLRHPEMDINITVARCISEILRVMAPGSPYNEEHMKDFIELAVITFEKLSSASGGCYTKMSKVLKALSKFDFSVLMSELEFDDLLVRLFKQFLAVADSNSPALLLKMKKIMTTIIKQSELIKPETVDLLVTSVRKENQIALPVCWQLARDVIKDCAAKLEPHLPDKARDMGILNNYYKKVEHICNNESVAEEVHGSLRKSIPFKTDTSNLRKDSIHKRKLECIDGSRSVVLAVSRCLRPHSSKTHDKQIISIDDSPLVINESVTEPQSVEHGENLVGSRIKVSSPDGKMSYSELCKSILIQPQSVEHGENLVGSRIKVSSPDGKIYCEGVVQSFDRGTKRHRLLHDDGDEQLLDLNRKHWELVENMPLMSDCMKQEVPENVSSSQCSVICVQGYNVKLSLAPILEALLLKHGDIAANCTFKTTYVRASLLEVVCNVVRRIQTADVTTIISQMEDIENQVSDAEAANINVSWLRTHLDAIHKKEKVMKKSTSFMDTKAKTIIVKKVAQRDIKDIRAELEMAEKFVKALDVLEKNLNDSILESKTEENLWAGQQIL
uniref:uncharacterized protein LOC122607246 n=1 Tax=Erigeron canadensis TaxID=72917 RepID=UPI001CB89AD8|nr:uncharacterized protein LOC122607246 [Erigeron canadensis]